MNGAPIHGERLPHPNRASVGAVVLALQLACGQQDDKTQTTFSGESDSEGADGTAGSATEGGDEGPERFDAGEGMATEGHDGDGPSTQVCRNIDVVIAVDNSSSMQEEMDALRGPVFDSFPQALLASGEGLDSFQLAVIDACDDPPLLHDTGESGFCDFSTGRNFMVSTSNTLPDEYHCVMDITRSGYMGQEDDCSGENDDEQPANTVAEAVSAPFVDGENWGFLRSDALLFVIAITDEDEQPTGGLSAREVADKLIAAKGDVRNVVFLGIGGASECMGLYGTAEHADLLEEIAGIFAAESRGVFWDLCAGDLAEGVHEALDVVDSACFDFNPHPEG